jgi:F-type H+-transporting ATPase subunit b
VQRLKIVLTAFCFLLVTALPAFAAGDGESHESWSNLAFRIVNLALFIGVIWHFFGKKIVAFFKSRTEGIAEELATLEKRKADTQKSLEDVEKRIANLEMERQSILNDYTAQGEALKAAIIEQAEKAATQITAQAKLTAQNEIKAAVDAMRAEMADKIVEATEQLIAEKLSATEHAKLIDKYLTKVVLN